MHWTFSFENFFLCKIDKFYHFFVEKLFDIVPESWLLSLKKILQNTDCFKLYQVCIYALCWRCLQVLKCFGIKFRREKDNLRMWRNGANVENKNVNFHTGVVCTFVSASDFRLYFHVSFTFAFRIIASFEPRTWRTLSNSVKLTAVVAS